MAKNTVKNDALSMFASTTSVKGKMPEKKTAQNKVVKEPAKKEKIVTEELPVEEKKTEEIKKEIIKETSTVNKENKSDESKVPMITLTVPKKENSRLGHSRSFYMKDSNYDKLKDLAEQNECSISDMLNFILNQIL